MKFIFADALDMIDPKFDFVADRVAEDRENYWGDVYPHEYFPTVPYDGVLVSRGVVGDDRFPGKYPNDLMMRFRRVGAREFLRLKERRFARMDIFGDCGAFSYADMEMPPYTPEMMLDFYADGRFTHGCSVDHIIFDFDADVRGMRGSTPAIRKRYEITLDNAQAFLKASRAMGNHFTPLGVIQGWSPDSKAQAARKLVKMGYRYLAVGGMVPLNARQIHLCLAAIRSQIPARAKLHLLGFAKAEQIHEFTNYGIASFDTTSPLRRAFKDARANYYHANGAGTLEYFSAIRVPQATENARLKRRAKSSGHDQEDLLVREQKALASLRRFDSGRASVRSALEAVISYCRDFICDPRMTADANQRAVDAVGRAALRTLENAPWKRCPCRVCREAGIDAIIFRGANRNKRRGFHNLFVFNEHLKRVTR